MGAFNWQEWATRHVFMAARSLKIGKRKAEILAEDAVKIAGPGKDRLPVKYRVAPGTKLRPGQRGKEVRGWWISEYAGRDAYTAPTEKTTFVSERDVFRLWRAVKKIVPLNPLLQKGTKPWEVKPEHKFTVADVAESMVKRKILPKRFKYAALFGGQYRQRYYFPRYLYLMRALDFIGYLRFGRVSWRLL